MNRPRGALALDADEAEVAGAARVADQHDLAMVPGAAQAERCISRNALVEDEDAWLKPSGSVTFRGGVLEISGGECQSLPDVLGLKLRIIPE
jgi:hypothetical protein